MGDGSGSYNKMMVARERQGACLNVYAPTKNGKCQCWEEGSRMQAMMAMATTTR